MGDCFLDSISPNIQQLVKSRTSLFLADYRLNLCLFPFHVLISDCWVFTMAKEKIF